MPTSDHIRTPEQQARIDRIKKAMEKRTLIVRHNDGQWGEYFIGDVTADVPERLKKHRP